MLSSKMKKIADDIGNVILSSYNKDYLSTLFASGIHIEDVIFQVLVLCCRYAYLISSEKHPLSFYIERDGLEIDLARQENHRVLDYVNEKFDESEKRTKELFGDAFQRPNIVLEKQPGRFPYYELSAFQYWEIRNIHDMKLVKAIIENRIPFSKKISNGRFIDLAGEYESKVEEQIKAFGKNAEETVFSSLQFFTLQTKYSFDFFYEIAKIMEESRVKEFPDMHNRIMCVAGTYKCMSILPELCPNAAADIDRVIQYPMIIQRRRALDSIVRDSAGGQVNQFLGAIIEANVLANAVRSHMHIGGVRLPQLIVSETNIEDWASVFAIYNVFQTHIPQKEWTNTRIKNVRKLYAVTSTKSMPDKNPENRP